MAQQNWIEDDLAQAGHRSTQTRKQICTYLLKEKGIFSAKDILDAHKKLDKVSVYRTLDLLQSLDIIHPTLMLDGHQMYELHQKKSHHHHIVCVECKKDECMPCKVVVPKKIKGFAKIHHEVHFTGVCNACA